MDDTLHTTVCHSGWLPSRSILHASCTAGLVAQDKLVPLLAFLLCVLRAWPHLLWIEAHNAWTALGGG
eukprot:2305999-Amphidinium_carterae.1